MLEAMRISFGSATYEVRFEERVASKGSAAPRRDVAIPVSIS